MIGYSFVPVLCVLPGVILDLVTKLKYNSKGTTELHVEDSKEKLVHIFVDGLAGMMGSFNAILFGVDPSVLAVLYALRIQSEEVRLAELQRQKREDAAAGIGGPVIVRVDVEKVDDCYHDRDMDIGNEEVAEMYRGL